ncbi:SDR family NAD(P)-dependent oxidoreductase [Alkalicoccus chagannorensis]|uniref:SDR family NAD(P)-dependent oxidoreductase n=1 Tax=Alkalicoccus chagannorensis TaxID=427072 RepID=UPI00041D6357
MRLKGKTAVITGGSGGIGKETAKLFLEEGAACLLVDVDQEAVEKAAEELKSFGTVYAVQADVSNDDDVVRWVKTAEEKLGRIDILFNNAGVEGKVKPLIEQEVEDFDFVMNVNVRGVFLGMKHVLPIMYKQESGSVINTSSVAGFIGSPGVLPYVTSKHAVIGATKTAALEAAPYQVRVNSIHPSPVNNRMMRSLEEGFSPGKAEEARQGLEQTIPLHRYGENADIAKLVLFLASDDAAFITGAQYRIDGGMAAN